MVVHVLPILIKISDSIFNGISCFAVLIYENQWYNVYVYIPITELVREVDIDSVPVCLSVCLPGLLCITHLKLQYQRP